MDEIAELRKRVPGEIFDYQVLMDVLSGYEKPRNRVTRLLSQGSITRIRKGLYCFGEDHRRGPVSREVLANLIYGPSYVSLDYALAYHGLIPERVDTVTSVTTRRSTEFQTAFGSYTYRMLAPGRYSAGISRESIGGEFFLIAVPEKALVDKVWTDSRFSGRNISDYGPYLIEDLRIDRDAMAALDQHLLRRIAGAWASKKIDNLVRFLEKNRSGGNA